MISALKLRCRDYLPKQKSNRLTVLEINLSSGLLLDLLDVLTAAADDDSDEVGRDPDDDAGRLRRQVRPGKRVQQVERV